MDNNSINLTDLVRQIQLLYMANGVLPGRAASGNFDFCSTFFHSGQMWKVALSYGKTCIFSGTVEGNVFKRVKHDNYELVGCSRFSHEYVNTFHWALEVILSELSFPSDLEATKMYTPCSIECSIVDGYECVQSGSIELLSEPCGKNPYLPAIEIDFSFSYARAFASSLSMEEWRERQRKGVKND